MNMRWMVLSILVLVWPTLAAGEESALSGEQITATLAGNTAVGNQNGTAWKQFFDANGETVYHAAGSDPSPGKWKVEGDKFCSQWPPREEWDCYAMTGEAAAVTWIFGGDSDPWPATMVPGNQLDQ